MTIQTYTFNTYPDHPIGQYWAQAKHLEPAASGRGCLTNEYWVRYGIYDFKRFIIIITLPQTNLFIGLDDLSVENLLLKIILFYLLYSLEEKLNLLVFIYTI